MAVEEQSSKDLILVTQHCAEPRPTMTFLLDESVRLVPLADHTNVADCVGTGGSGCPEFEELYLDPRTNVVGVCCKLREALEKGKVISQARKDKFFMMARWRRNRGFQSGEKGPRAARTAYAQCPGCLAGTQLWNLFKKEGEPDAVFDRDRALEAFLADQRALEERQKAEDKAE
ncbi:MAG: hypothetical protein WC882_04590 [Candidatus Gracilibacteria bacterium]